VESHTSTIVFTNSRRLAERLALALNELAARRWQRERHERAAAEDAAAVAAVAGTGAAGTTVDDSDPDRHDGSAIVIEAGATDPTAAAGEAEFDGPPYVARAHHGSIARETRKEMEEQLKAGQLP